MASYDVARDICQKFAPHVIQRVLHPDIIPAFIELDGVL